MSVVWETPTFIRLKVSSRPSPRASDGNSSGDISMVSAARAQLALLALMAIAAAVANAVPANVAAAATFRLTNAAPVISGESKNSARYH